MWVDVRIDSVHSDTLLCARAAAGDRSAEEELVFRHHRLVKACARPFFLAGGDSEDLIQEGMLGLLSAIREFDPGRNVSFVAFAELCIRRRIITAVKSASSDKHTPLNAYVSLEASLFDGTYSTVDSRLDNPEDIFIRQEGLDLLYRRISASLSDLEAQVLPLYLAGLSYTEIASKVNRSQKAVDNAVQRIRKKTARQFQFSDCSES